MDSLPLGVGGLGGRTAGQMQAGRIYALEAPIPSLRFPLINGMLAHALSERVTATVLLRSKPEAYLAQLDTPARFDIEAAMTQRMLNVFVMQSDFQKKLFQAGPEKMMTELARFGVPRGSLLVIEHAADLLNLFDLSLATRQLDVIGEWCAAMDITGLLVFSQSVGRNMVSPVDLLDSLSGMAILDQTQDGLQISFPYWQTHGQVAAGVTLPLQITDNGDYLATPMPANATPRTLGASSLPSPRPAGGGASPRTRHGPSARNGFAGTRDFEGRTALAGSDTPQGILRAPMRAQRSNLQTFI